MAADQFIVLPGSRLEESVMAQAEGSELRSIYAGYHWFGDWGRDTMISLEGLTLSTGRYREAGAILRTFSHYVRDGLLPNLFPEGERAGAVSHGRCDALVLPRDRALRRGTGDRVDRRATVPGARSRSSSSTSRARASTSTSIPQTACITAAAEGYQLTWMDAKVDDWVVTPRRGKPVEIQALWYNALQLMAAMGAELGLQPPAPTRSCAERARESFNQRYWNDAARLPVRRASTDPTATTPSIRPNQVFAISLPHPILDRAPLGAGDRRRARTDCVTPYGLRTLSADHPDYKPHYRGDLRSRDAAYHQGTVWPWLIGHYIDAYLQRASRIRPARAQLLQAFPRASAAMRASAASAKSSTPKSPYAPGRLHRAGVERRRSAARVAAHAVALPG